MLIFFLISTNVPVSITSNRLIIDCIEILNLRTLFVLNKLQMLSGWNYISCIIILHFSPKQLSKFQAKRHDDSGYSGMLYKIINTLQLLLNCKCADRLLKLTYQLRHWWPRFSWKVDVHDWVKWTTWPTEYPLSCFTVGFQPSGYTKSSLSRVSKLGLKS